MGQRGSTRSDLLAGERYMLMSWTLWGSWTGMLNYAALTPGTIPQHICGKNRYRARIVFSFLNRIRGTAEMCGWLTNESSNQYAIDDNDYLTRK